MIDKESLTQDVLGGLSVKQIQEKYSCSRSTVYYYKTMYDLKGLSPNSRKAFRNTGLKTCNICNEEKSLDYFYSNGCTSTGKRKYKAACSKCETSKRNAIFYSYLLEYLKVSNREYRCCRCGYTNIFGSLDFHHRNSEDKEFEISRVNKTISFNRFIEEVAPEIDKCDILCPNCHRLEHLIVG